MSRQPGTIKTLATAFFAAALMTVTARAGYAWTVDEAKQPLVVLSVLDAETGAPLERFRVVPGVPYHGTGDRSAAVWQPHLVRESAGGRYEWPRERSYETFRLRAEAEGYRPAMTAWIHEADSPGEVTIRMRRDRGIRGVVVLPDGSPAAGATLGIALPNRTLRLTGRTIERSREPPAETLSERWRQPLTVRADADGRYRLPAEIDPAALLVVVHEGGYLERPFPEILVRDGEPRPSRTLRLAPWGRISGRVLWVDHPGADEEIEFIVSRETMYPDMVGAFGSVRSDALGRFEFNNIPPGRVQLSRLGPPLDGKEETRYQFPVMHVDVRAGDATEVVLGGRGRVVAGRLTGLDSYDGVTLRLHPTAPHIGLHGDDERWQGWLALQNSPLGAVVFRDAIAVGKDGTFRIEGLVPESYQLFVNDSGRALLGGTGFTVQPAAGHAADTRHDLGAMRVTRGTP